ncbi:zinc-ribbon domain-containing protein [bacterium]|nr:zinc-ribbon domain-containing protein [bacterium]
MFCKNCGAPMDDRAVVCPKCGVPCEQTKSEQEVVDNGGFAWGLLGCCIPLAGLILYFVWKDSKPNTAHALCVGAIVGTVINVISSIIYGILIGMSSY